MSSDLQATRRGSAARFNALKNLTPAEAEKMLEGQNDKIEACCRFIDDNAESRAIFLKLVERHQAAAERTSLLSNDAKEQTPGVSGMTDQAGNTVFFGHPQPLDLNFPKPAGPIKGINPSTGLAIGVTIEWDWVNTLVHIGRAVAYCLAIGRLISMIVHAFFGTELGTIFLFALLI